MNNFKYSIPTTVYFGKNQIEHLGEEMSRISSHVLLVYGGGSIKKTGIYDKVLEILKRYSITVTELSGVEPNPRIQSVQRGVQLCRENSIGAVLAVGGGSAIDCAKVVAAGACYDGDPWDLVVNPKAIKSALPVVSVLTVAATGSEMDAFAVISKPETSDKLGTYSSAIIPKVSILDPSYTFSVSKSQTSAGIADIMSHVFENYFTNANGAFIQARFCEGLLKTCIHYGKIVLEQPEDYEARANLMWAASLAINGIVSYGADVAWSVHPMEHELSAFYDIVHGVGLAILTPNWMDYVLNDETVEQFAEYGVNVWNIDPGLDAYSIARTAIANTRAFFQELGLPSSLKEIGIGKEKFTIMAEKAAEKGLSRAFVPLDAQGVAAIYEMSY